MDKKDKLMRKTKSELCDIIIRKDDVEINLRKEIELASVEKKLRENTEKTNNEFKEEIDDLTTSNFELKNKYIRLLFMSCIACVISFVAGLACRLFI